MEQEMGLLQHEFRAVERDYGENVLNLTLASTHIRKLLANGAVARFLKAGHAHICLEFDKITSSEAW